MFHKIKVFFRRLIIGIVLNPLTRKFISYDEFAGHLEAKDWETFYTYHIRPRYAKDISVRSIGSASAGKVAVIVSRPYKLRETTSRLKQSRYTRKRLREH